MKTVIIIFWFVFITVGYFLYKYDSISNFAKKYFTDDKDDENTILVKFILFCAIVAFAIAFTAYKFI